MLSQDALARYHSEGYVVAPGFKSPAAIATARARAEAIVGEFDMAEAPSVFTTRDQGVRTDTYFLHSGDKVRCFFEEEKAFDAQGRLRQAKSLSINKFGHSMACCRTTARPTGRARPGTPTRCTSPTRTRPTIPGTGCNGPRPACAASSIHAAHNAPTHAAVNLGAD